MTVFGIIATLRSFGLAVDMLHLQDAYAFATVVRLAVPGLALSLTLPSRI